MAKECSSPHEAGYNGKGGKKGGGNGLGKKKEAERVTRKEGLKDAERNEVERAKDGVADTRGLVGCAITWGRTWGRWCWEVGVWRGTSER